TPKDWSTLSVAGRVNEKGGDCKRAKSTLTGVPVVVQVASEHGANVDLGPLTGSIPLAAMARSAGTPKLFGNFGALKQFPPRLGREQTLSTSVLMIGKKRAVPCFTLMLRVTSPNTSQFVIVGSQFVVVVVNVPPRKSRSEYGCPT